MPTNVPHTGTAVVEEEGMDGAVCVEVLRITGGGSQRRLEGAGKGGKGLEFWVKGSEFIQEASSGPTTALRSNLTCGLFS